LDKKVKIPAAYPSITNIEIQMANIAMKNGWGKNMNLYINNFSKKLSKYVGMKYCLPVSHCTDAIHLALLALNIKKGDEVIVPDLTWVASVAPLCYVGAKPVFVDISEKNLCINPLKIEEAITKRTKAIIAVNLFGNIGENLIIKKICKKHKLHFIEDAAESLGAKKKSKKAGSFGDISVFSFNATKLIMAGQGGAFCTNNKKLFDRAKIFAHHGMVKSGKNPKYYWSKYIGHNYNWTNIQAAIASAQLSRIDELIKYKKKIYQFYKKYFNNLKDVTITVEDKSYNQVFWIVYAKIHKPINKTNFCNKFKKFNIDIRPMFYQLSQMPPFHSKKDIKKNEISNLVSKQYICLPNGYDLNENKIIKIYKAFKKILNN